MVVGDWFQVFRRVKNMEVLIMVGFLVFWVALNRWVLPKMGVQT
jgi:hypothetical protein